MDKYFVYGVTLNPEFAKKFDSRYFIYTFDNRKVLSEESWMRFISLKELTSEQILTRFKGTSGINGYVVESDIIKINID